MNTTRFIEATTFVSIGALCAAAILTLTVPSRHAVAATQEVAAHAVATHDVTTAQAAPVETVTIVAKRLTAAQKSAMLKSGSTTI